MCKDPFKEYIKYSEENSTMKEKIYFWSTAIGLQDVDKLKPSSYLIERAKENIEEKISIETTEKLIDEYYVECKKNGKNNIKTEEADKVSVQIMKLLLEQSFSFTPNQYISIHRELFKGIYEHAGKIRNYNISKKEWILNRESVIYGTASELLATLEYDLYQERNFSYKKLTMDETIKHLCIFISRLWQIHIFEEGNTRTIAVFFLKYLRTLGFDVKNDVFKENSWYFRNALVRANYKNLKKDIYETTEYLELFIRNLLLNEKNILKNRDMKIE